MARAAVDPAGTGGARCGGPEGKAGGCGQPARWAWLEDSRDPRLVRRVLLEPGPDEAGPWLQVGMHAGAPRLRALRRHETPPPGKRWMPHAATCPVGKRRVRRPRALQLQLDLEPAGGRR